ncbi:sigma-70 family RNA polymerase sigma factor [Streptosporangium sp. 'caverna']|uniref:sigma-70 family RNA polymerase sigma factor n=1 Tax=Streptosporangium sp. 'caverna' TaxID=2202249 RepID=UPI000D7D6814|nr:sigma-70 family RNA polymerase sigma factor [Streptosporangium sp. 'caverna']AWS44760.1 RNA polymerase subunit sigma-70 [Streptosporangium sp. 'caverna']
MDRHDLLAERFEAHRGHLLTVAYRMLSSLSDAEDAVQETWLRLSRSDVSGVENLAGWLTAVVARVCLDLLRSRRARLDEPVGWDVPESITSGRQTDPEHEAVMADSVGRALLVVLARLAPAERIAFVLHDMFAVPFDEIAPIVGRSPVTAKKLASRARQRVKGTAVTPSADLAWHRQVVNAFLDAARGRDINGLLAVLDPGVVRRADAAALPVGVPTEIRGARAVVEETLLLSQRARFAEAALVNGTVGVVVAPYGRLLLVLVLTVEKGRIAEYEVIADPARLHHLDLAVLG